MAAERGVGVVIPARQAGRFVGEAVASALGQSIAPVDVVVVDDGSTDDTAAVARRAGARVLRTTGVGIGPARNLGVREVRGEVLAFLDADDLWTPDKLALQLPSLRAGRVVFGHERRFADGQPRDVTSALRASPLPGCMLLLRTDFLTLGGYRDAGLGEALDLLLRQREAGLEQVVLDAHVLWRRVHAANATRGHRADLPQYTAALRASLERRRAREHEETPR